MVERATSLVRDCVSMHVVWVAESRAMPMGCHEGRLAGFVELRYEFDGSEGDGDVMRRMQTTGAVKDGVLGGLLALALVVGLGLASGRAWAHAPEEPAAAATTNGVEVTVEASFTNGATVLGWIEERAARTLEALEPKLADGDRIRIIVRGGAYDYRISLELLRRGTVLPAAHQPSEIACACSSDEMLDTVAKGIEAAVRTLDELAKQERAEAEAAAERRRREEEQRRQEAERKRQEAERAAGYRPSKLGRTGIGIFGLGGLVVVTGGIIAARPPQTQNDRGSLGYGVLATGVAAAVSGLTVLLVDVVRCRRNPSRCGDSPTSWMTRDALWAARSNGGPR